jgi:hypothetical protein
MREAFTIIILCLGLYFMVALHDSTCSYTMQYDAVQGTLVRVYNPAHRTVCYVAVDYVTCRIADCAAWLEK